MEKPRILAIENPGPLTPNGREKVATQIEKLLLE